MLKVICVIFAVIALSASDPLPPTPECPPGLIPCKYDPTVCLTPDQLCNGYPDCVMETGTLPECCQFGFRCPNERCLSSRYVCDGDNDCGNWEDEPESCGVSRATPCHGFHC